MLLCFVIGLCLSALSTLLPFSLFAPLAKKQKKPTTLQNTFSIFKHLAFEAGSSYSISNGPMSTTCGAGTGAVPGHRGLSTV